MKPHIITHRPLTQAELTHNCLISLLPDCQPSPAATLEQRLELRAMAELSAERIARNVLPAHRSFFRHLHDKRRMFSVEKQAHWEFQRRD